MITVEYQPGGSDQVHKHHAQVLVYVLEGSVNGPTPTAGQHERAGHEAVQASLVRVRAAGLQVEHQRRGHVSTRQ